MQQEYEKYRLNWMLNHGYTLKDLMCIIEKIQKDVNYDGAKISPTACLDNIEHWNGFNGELWASYSEWLANEAK